MKKGEGESTDKRRAPAVPEVVWLREPSRERLVRAGLRLLGMPAAEIERAMREEPVHAERPRRKVVT